MPSAKKNPTPTGAPLPRWAAWLHRHWLALVVNAGALAPLVWLVWAYSTDNLGADPVATINHVTGDAAINLLILGLAATPIYILTGYRQVLGQRRSLGLYAFLYAVLHFLDFVALDYGLDVSSMLRDALLNKPYIQVGLAALLILVPLAITSTRGWQKRLGRSWTRLHKLVYAAGVLAVVHFLWQAKAPVRYQPLLYALLLTTLLLLRLPPIRRRMVHARQRAARKSQAPQAVDPAHESLTGA